jgi:hypothetical protein
MIISALVLSQSSPPLQREREREREREKKREGGRERE